MIRGVAAQWLCGCLQKGCTATVELITSKGVYADLGGTKILLCGSEFGVVPTGIAIDGWERLQFQQGQVLTGRSGKLHVGRCSVSVKPVELDIVIHNPERSAFDQMRAQLKKDPGTGFGLLLTDRELPPECQIVAPLLKNLYDAIINADANTMSNAVRSLIGLGKGLTPSGDDVLAGLVYGLRHSPMRDSASAKELVYLLLTYAPKQTNAVSVDYLCAITADHPFQRLSDAWRDPVGYGPKLMEIGSNSGRELLLGLIMAADIIANA